MNIEQLREEIFSKTNIIFGHNRWATHGEKNIKNTHPHMSNNKKIVIVHNGIIENFLEIKIFLLKKGFFFYGETDTEIICNLMEYFKVENPTEPFEKIIQRTIDRVKGTFAFIIYFHDEKKNYFVFVEVVPY